MDDYAVNGDLRYAEKAVTTYEYDGMKPFNIPSLMPLIPHGKPKISTSYVSNNNLMNKGVKIAGGQFKTANYLDLGQSGEGEAGETSIVIFVGGDQNDPIIIG